MLCLNFNSYPYFKKWPWNFWKLPFWLCSTWIDRTSLFQVEFALDLKSFDFFATIQLILKQRGKNTFIKLVLNELGTSFLCLWLWLSNIFPHSRSVNLPFFLFHSGYPVYFHYNSYQVSSFQNIIQPRK